MTRLKPAAFLIVMLLLTSIPLGCAGIRGLAVLFAPRQIAKPEIKLSGRVVIVIDTVRPGQANPVFESTMHKRIIELLRENKVEVDVVTYEAMVELRHLNPDFASWSVQKIGRELGADQVLYVRINDLRLAQKDDPVMTPSVSLHLKVISPRAPAAEARLWPDADGEREGREQTWKRPPLENDCVERVDSETAKLARETAYYVARNFYEYDLELPPPREP